MKLFKQKRISGFTLIEIMVVIAIIGILAAIVWPTFDAQMKKQRRKAPIIAMLQIAQEMQKCKTNDASYSGTSCPANGSTFADNDPKFTDSTQPQRYTITLAVTGGGTGYTLTAARDTPGEDPDCTALIVDNLGRKTATGNLSATPHRCWGD